MRIFRKSPSQARAERHVVRHVPTKRLRDAIKAVAEGNVTEYDSPAAVRRAIEAEKAKLRRK